jgi:hypothetical protein
MGWSPGDPFYPRVCGTRGPVSLRRGQRTGDLPLLVVVRASAAVALVSFRRMGCLWTRGPLEIRRKNETALRLLLIVFLLWDLQEEQR